MPGVDLGYEIYRASSPISISIPGGSSLVAIREVRGQEDISTTYIHRPVLMTVSSNLYVFKKQRRKKVSQWHLRRLSNVHAWW
jgi:hypothetical protein